jgi:uncharacterized protein
MINRILEKAIEYKLFKGKVVILFGPRQCGKTTLMNSLLKNTNKKTLFLDGEEYNVREQFTNPTSEKLKLITGNYEIVFIDEAQKIKDIGSVLKLFNDKIKNVQVIATGSSAFELANKTGEPLTGRKYELTLLPISFKEMVNHTNFIEETSKLESRLIYGCYPEIIMNPMESEQLIKLLAKSYLFKDLFTLENINNPEVFEKIIRAIALQLGSEVSYKEIANTVGVNHHTVEKYLSLLERAYIIFKLPAYSGNIRNEIRKGKKYYFYDNGIRNAVIGNFNVIELRNDIGALWENYLVSERMKYLTFSGKDYKKYFWRTTQQQEIDYIEEISGEIFCYEFKWNKKAKAKFSKTFTENYSPKKTKLITSENYYDFLMND